jgi:hypothetical protein
LRELTQVVSPHRVSVTASSLQCTRPAAAVDIGNAPVAQGYKVRDGLTQAAAVIASHHIDAWGWRRETYRNDGHPTCDVSKDIGVASDTQEEHPFAAVSEQLVDCLALASRVCQCTQDNAIPECLSG